MSDTGPTFGGTPRRPGLPTLGSVGRRRTLLGLALGVVLPAVIEGAVTATGYRNFAMVMLFQLAGAVAVAMLGGFWPAVLAAVTGTLLLNYFSTDPVGSLGISDPNGVAALLIFLLVACSVALAVGTAARRQRTAVRAAADSKAMSELARGILSFDGDMEAFVEKVRGTLGLRAVTLMDRRVQDAADSETSREAPREDTTRWDVVASSGEDPPVTLAAADTVAETDGSYALLASGPPLDARGRRLLEAFATYLVAIRQSDQLASSRVANRRLEEGNAIRTAILRAVSHDLRTPLAGIKLSVSSLRQPGIVFEPDDEAELLATIEDSADRLAQLVSNLLDMSRISADTVRPLLRPVRWREVLLEGRSAVGAEPGRVVDRLPAGAPPVDADPVLLERIVANLVENALVHAPGSPVELLASWGQPGPSGRPSGELRVVDHGQGVPPAQLISIFSPFQRLDDAPGDEGVGLGLAVAKGFTEAMEGRLWAEPTVGGGLTMVVSLPLSAAERTPS